MKLYDFKMAPNPQRVNMFIAEKGIKIPTVEINTRERAQFADSFKSVNPISQVPVLELNDGPASPKPWRFAAILRNSIPNRRCSDTKPQKKQ